MKSGIVAVLAVGATALLSGTATAQEETTVNTNLTVNATGGGLHGNVVAPFDTRTEGERPCEADREMTVFVKADRGGFRKISSVTSSGDGSWSVQAPREQTIYKIRVASSDFVYSPRYGELRDGRCLPTTVVGKKVTPRKFKVLSSVLGTRVTRGRAGAAQLPRTGPVPVPFLVAGMVLIGAGWVLVRPGTTS